MTLDHAGALGGELHWIESRPAEKGRNAWMRRTAAGDIAEVMPAELDIRSRVHEYGGLPWVVAGTGDSCCFVAPQFADQRLRVLAPDGVLRTVTPPGCRYADGHAHPDGRHALFVREDHRSPGEAVNTVVRVDLQRSEHEGDVLAQGSDFVAAPRVSPDGRHLAWLSWNHPSMPWDATELRVAGLAADGLTDPVVVAGGPGESVIEPCWGADGSLYFLSDRSGWWNLWRWQHGRAEALTALEAELGGPLWNLGQRSYAVAGDGRVLLRIDRQTVCSLAVLDAASGRLDELDLPFVAFGSVSLLDDDTGCAIAAAVDGLPALITFDLASGRHSVVRAAGPAPLPPEAVSRGQSIEFPTTPAADGTPRHAQAWFHPPCHPDHVLPEGERPPLIVLLHGGPTSQAGPALKIDLQFWTSRGFAVVNVNYGGSTGFGRAYRERLLGQWGPMDLADAVAAVDHLAAIGAVDGRRVAIRGRSAGGFSVLSGLAFTDRFAAGINYFGVADLESLVTDTHKFESRYLDSLIAPWPEGRALYAERSPVHHMHRCRGALLTLQGTDDRAVPVEQSRAIVEAARRAGCPVAYLEFEGEGHGFRQPAHIVQAMQAELVFLGRVFGFTPPGDLPALEIWNAQRLKGG
jgi:dipeptidyl aminopeptidase/acylaminoacyl peptidase